MIICSREEAQKLLSVESNLFHSDERNKDIVSEFINYNVEEIKHGRGEGRLNLDEEQRKEIATLAHTSGLTQEEVAKLTGVSPSQVSAIKNAATSTSTYHTPNESLEPHIESIKTQLSNAAQNKMMEAILALSPEKIHGAKGRDIAGIAKDMSAIVKNLNNDGIVINNNKVLVYKPRIKEEDDFDIITINE